MNMKKSSLIAIAIVAVLGSLDISLVHAAEGEYQPVPSGGGWLVSRDGGKTFSSGGFYPTRDAAQKAANKINRQAKKRAKKEARQENKGK
ncbi:MAG: hypothetical protein R3E83_08740 [Burkholderiaceae bacterium]